MPEFDAFFRIDRMIHLPTPTMGLFDSLKIIELAQLRFVMRQGGGKLSHRHDLRNLPRNSYPGRNWPVLSYRIGRGEFGWSLAHYFQIKSICAGERLFAVYAARRGIYPIPSGEGRISIPRMFLATLGSCQQATKFGILPIAKFHYKMTILLLDITFASFSNLR